MKKTVFTITFLCLTFVFVHAQSFFKDINNKWGLKNKEGKVIVSGKYDNLFQPYFNEDMASVAIWGKKGHILWGFIDDTGKEVIELKYYGAESFSEGLAVVCIGTGETDITWGGRKEEVWLYR